MIAWRMCWEALASESAQLLAYGAKHKDPRVQLPRVKSDLTWCAKGTGAYVSAEPDNNQPKVRSKRKKKKKKRGNDDGK